MPSDMADTVPRINIHTANELIRSDDAVLVCAYADEEKCKSVALPRSLTWTEFADRRAEFDHRKRIILYCA